MTARSVFETEFGERIAVDPRIEEKIYPSYGLNRPAVIEAMKRDCTEVFIPERLGAAVRLPRTRGVLNDLYSYAVLVDFLKELQILPGRTFDRALDIAGAEGVHAALFRANYAKRAEVADILNGSDPRFTSKFRRLTRYNPLLRSLQLLDRFYSRSSRFRDSFGKALPSNMLVRYNRKHLNVPSSDSFFDFKFRRTPKVDVFHVGDWKETVEGTYDLIVNFQSLWLWDHTIAFPLVSERLEPGGVFAAMAPYYWSGRPVGGRGALIGGGFPFFEQRLTRSDVKRYYATYKPDLADLVEHIYDSYDPHKPKVNNYVEAGRRCGLVLRGHKRLYDRPSHYLLKAEHATNGLRSIPESQQIEVSADEVLRDINHYRPDIVYEDLITSAVVLVFERV